MNHRDKNGNGLLEWFVEPDYLTCKCAESGMDNSPRFDKETLMDAIDFSTFFAFDALNLSYIYKELSCEHLAKKWRKIYETAKAKINACMWDEEIGTYSDCLFTGDRTKVITPCSFLPLIAEIPSQEQAERMVKTLTDPKHIWTKFPLATMSKSEPDFSTDYWRGSTWLNFNFLVANGLKKYGFDGVAQEIVDKTLENVDRWYKQTGTIFEHYDADGIVSPFDCIRNGKPPLAKPDRRKQIHSITEFNWSACFTMLFIQNEWYV
jgi:neutral trehalase